MNRIIPVIACIATASFFAAPSCWGLRVTSVYEEGEYLDSYAEIDIDPSSSSIVSWAYAEIEGAPQPYDVYIEINALVNMNGAELDTTYTMDYGYVEADLDDSITEPCASYYLFSESDSVDDDLDVYSSSNASDYAFGPVPTGETVSSTSNFWNDPGDIGTTFYLNLTPAGTLFDCGTVKEVISGFDDICNDYWGGTVHLNPPPATSGIVGYAGNYQDEIKAGAGWVDYYMLLVAAGSIPGGCGWSFNQTVQYQPTWSGSLFSYANNTNGQNIYYGAGASATLQTCRAGTCANNN